MCTWEECLPARTGRAFLHDVTSQIELTTYSILCLGQNQADQNKTLSLVNWDNKPCFGINGKGKNKMFDQDLINLFEHWDINQHEFIAKRKDLSKPVLIVILSNKSKTLNVIKFIWEGVL